MNDEIFNFMLEHIEKPDKHPMHKKEDPKDEVSPEEALEIFREIINVYAKHNITYQCACKISLALNEAMVTSIAEIIKADIS